MAIAHPVVEKYFQVLKVHKELKHIKDLSVKKRPNYGLFSGFVTFWIKYPIFYMYMRSFVIKNLFLDLFNLVLIVFPYFIMHAKCV